MPEGLWAGDNLTKDERMRQQTVGKVKKALCQVRGNDTGVDVSYKRCMVRLNKKVVAKFNGDELVLTGEARDCREAIEGLISAMKNDM